MITYGAVQALTFDISGLATSASFLGGYESNEIDNSTTRWDDIEISCDGITGHATTAPVIGQRIELYLWGNDITIATVTIDTLDGTASVETLSHDAVRQALRFVAAPTVTAAVAALKYPILSFGVSQFFGGNLPAFCGMYLTHNHAGALGLTQASLFTWRGVKYTAT